VGGGALGLQREAEPLFSAEQLREGDVAPSSSARRAGTIDRRRPEHLHASPAATPVEFARVEIERSQTHSGSGLLYAVGGVNQESIAPAASDTAATAG
jgi:hypothetical protein